MSSNVRWATLSQLRSRPGACLADGQVVAVMPWLKRAAAKRAADLMVARAGAPLQVLAVHDDLRAGPVAVWNGAMGCVHSELLVYCAEDAFAGRYWLRYALQALAQHSGAGLLAFNDGKWFGQLAAFGLVRRRWLDPLYGGALFHPGYSQHYGDTELTLIARQQQALAYHPHALLIEVDHAKDGRRVNPLDHALFQRRAATGFDQRVSDPALRNCVA
jgi:hypothetical protein